MIQSNNGKKYTGGGHNIFEWCGKESLTELVKEIIHENTWERIF